MHKDKTHIKKMMQISYDSDGRMYSYIDESREAFFTVPGDYTSDLVTALNSETGQYEPILDNITTTRRTKTLYKNGRVDSYTETISKDVEIKNPIGWYFF